MPTFPQPTRARQRWVLWCLLFCWGIVFASPLLTHHGMTEVCGSDGVKWVNADDSPDSLPAPALDCALCLPAALPTPAADPAFAERPRHHTLVARGENSVPPAPVAMPPPARGPPLFQNQTQEVHT